MTRLQKIIMKYGSEEIIPKSRKQYLRKNLLNYQNRHFETKSQIFKDCINDLELMCYQDYVNKLDPSGNLLSELHSYQLDTIGYIDSDLLAFIGYNLCKCDAITNQQTSCKNSCLANSDYCGIHN